jgi:hypothetical protein
LRSWPLRLGWPFLRSWPFRLGWPFLRSGPFWLGWPFLRSWPLWLGWPFLRRWPLWLGRPYRRRWPRLRSRPFLRRWPQRRLIDRPGRFARLHDRDRNRRPPFHRQRSGDYDRLRPAAVYRCELCPIGAGRNLVLLLHGQLW